MTSKQRWEGSAPLRAMAAPTSTAKPGVASWRPERLMETTIGGASGGWRACQAAAWAAASATTQAPSGTTRPVSSATGMNSAGRMSPRSGSWSRTSASAPASAPVGRSTSGW